MSAGCAPSGLALHLREHQGCARGAQVFGIVGRGTGYTAKQGDVVVVIPQVNPDRVTPLSEGMQGVVWHCLVSHPALQARSTKW